MAPAESVSPFRDYAYTSCQFPSPASGEPSAAATLEKPRRCFAEECADDAANLDASPALLLPAGTAVSGGPMDCDTGDDQQDAAGAAAAATGDADAALPLAACKPMAACTQPPPPPSPVSFATPALPPAARAVLGLYGATQVRSGAPDGINAAASALISAWGQQDTFYVFDLGEVARLYSLWTAAMPRIQPFYAVKCNPEPGIVAMLNALGAGFDCASIQELQRAMALGVPQDRIIFANPCKRPADFRYAAEHGVETTTFDCVEELKKIAAGECNVGALLAAGCHVRLLFFYPFVCAAEAVCIFSLRSLQAALSLTAPPSFLHSTHPQVARH